jgi:hypothetical protein
MKRVRVTSSTRAGRKREADASSRDAVPAYELGAVLVDAETRILQVHRLDAVSGHRHREPRVGDRLFRGIPDDARASRTRAPGVDPVEVDERHRLARTIAIRHTGAQCARHEREMRIGVQRFDGTLRGRQFRAPIDLVVGVAGTLRKHRPKHVDVRHDAVGALIEARRHALIEIARGRVKGTAQGARIG